MSEGRRARPQPTPETQHFWDGTRAGELRLQRCNACRSQAQGQQREVRRVEQSDDEN